MALRSAVGRGLDELIGSEQSSQLGLEPVNDWQHMTLPIVGFLSLTVPSLIQIQVTACCLLQITFESR